MKVIFKNLSEQVVCQRCGAIIKRTSSNQKYCENCRKAAKHEKNRARLMRKKGLAFVPKTVILPKEKIINHKYDFAKITKYCAEHHITYGEAQKLGLLDNARFYRK